MKLWMMKDAGMMVLLCALCLAVLMPSSLASAAESLPENPDHDGLVLSMSTDLRYDENNRLVSHALVYVDSPACRSVFVHKHGRGGLFTVHPLQGYAQQEVFPFRSEVCQAACVEKGVERSLAHSIMPHKYFEYHHHHMSFSEWFKSQCAQVEVCFINYHYPQQTIDTYWIDNNSEPQPHIQGLEYGERNTRCFASFVGHAFRVVASGTDEVIAERVVIEAVTIKAFGKSPPSDRRQRGHDFEPEIRATLHSEWGRHNRVTRTFSELGFKKGRLPDDVFASMGSLYYNNRHNVVQEEWRGRGVFVNWWETRVLFLQVPWRLKQIYQGRLRELVEAWAGVPVEETVMYGFRQYSKGARLLTHVDHHDTHAVSLIVNVAQGNLTQPWPVEVQDHADRLHEVVMEPGDVVYYESAKCLHARNRPMQGGEDAYYVNLFTHYKPIAEGEWWNQPNPEGTPEAVREVEGECRLTNTGVTETHPGGGQLGLVSAIQCDDSRLGSNISPSLFSASSAQDLIRWWQMTTPGYKKKQKDDKAAESLASNGEL